MVIGIAVLAALAGKYVLSLWLHPSTPCRRCAGTGKRRAFGVGRPQRCGTCRGLGERARLGVRVWRRAQGMPSTPAWVDEVVAEKEMDWSSW